MTTVEKVKDYYTNNLNCSDDLKTNACCTLVKYPDNIKKLIANIHTDVQNTYYGCGLVIPDCLTNCNVLDLGCGTGFDVYIVSQLVGENGKVLGIDMTDKQLEIAESFRHWHTHKFNYETSNVEFKKGFIEELDTIFIPDNSQDIVISNCVINLCQDKKKVFSQVHRVLKNGGEMYFSDVYSSKRIPEELKNDKVLLGECLSGALYWNDFMAICREIGFIDVRTVKSSRITINNDEISEKLKGIEFYSVTYRLFKLSLENDCEDYGQSVVYNGSIENNAEYWDLDNHHRFTTGVEKKVCGNTWNMLHETRFRDHFKFIGDFKEHKGIFPGCGKDNPYKNIESNNCC
jgi:arsenite methyltransferase